MGCRRSLGGDILLHRIWRSHQLRTILPRLPAPQSTHLLRLPRASHYHDVHLVPARWTLSHAELICGKNRYHFRLLWCYTTGCATCKLTFIKYLYFVFDTYLVSNTKYSLVDSWTPRLPHQLMRFIKCPIKCWCLLTQTRFVVNSLTFLILFIMN